MVNSFIPKAQNSYPEFTSISFAKPQTRESSRNLVRGIQMHDYSLGSMRVFLVSTVLTFQDRHTAESHNPDIKMSVSSTKRTFCQRGVQTGVSQFPMHKPNLTLWQSWLQRGSSTGMSPHRAACSTAAPSNPHILNTGPPGPGELLTVPLAMQTAQASRCLWERLTMLLITGRGEEWTPFSKPYPYTRFY